jgi:hypothetical protein
MQKQTQPVIQQGRQHATLPRIYSFHIFSYEFLSIFSLPHRAFNPQQGPDTAATSQQSKPKARKQPYRMSVKETSPSRQHSSQSRNCADNECKCKKVPQPNEFVFLMKQATEGIRPDRQPKEAVLHRGKCVGR